MFSHQNLMSKIFLTDVDGVLVNFSLTFEKWVKSTGLKTATPHLRTPAKYFKIADWVIDESVNDIETLVTEFFESDCSHHFVQWPDSVAIKHLSDNGWKFIAITAIGRSEKARRNRQICLDNLYGKYTFSDVLTVDPFDSKLDVLKTFSPTVWVDDTPRHVTDGIEAGHLSFHLQREGDIRRCHSPDAVIVKDWHEIVAYVEQKWT